MKIENQRMESRQEKLYRNKDDSMCWKQPMYDASGLTNEECKQFSDHAVEMGNRSEACITKNLEEIQWKLDELEKRMKKVEHKGLRAKKKNRMTYSEVKKLKKNVKSMLKTLSEMQKKQEELDKKVGMLEDIMIWNACIMGQATPLDTLKDVYRVYKSLYKDMSRERARNRLVGVNALLDTSHEMLN